MSAHLLKSMLSGIAFAIVVAIMPVVAEPHDQDAARQAVERGEMRPLADILDEVRGKLPGEIVGVEIESNNGRWFYEFRVLSEKGRQFEVYVDAQSAEIHQIEEK
jgi:uncharacterized membrane protein YkoI